MRILRLLLLLTIAGGVYHYRHAHHDGSDVAASHDDGDVAVRQNGGDPAVHHGFVQMPEAAGFDTSTVTIVAAENCLHEEAQRADRLAEQLRDRGVRVLRTHEVGFHRVDPALAGRVSSVMNGALPIVFIHGLAKDNPSLDEVLAEYQTAQD